MGSGTLRTVWRYARWLLLALIVIYLALLAVGIWHTGATQKTADAVAYIQSRHISPQDVDGKHLPLSPNKTENDSTVAGIDANQNGIRDDVELAIFDKYPTNKSLRAAALQYAMGEQLYLTAIADPLTWKAVAVQLDRGYQCLGDQYNTGSIQSQLKALEQATLGIKNMVINSFARISVSRQADQFTTSYSLPNENYCDVGA